MFFLILVKYSLTASREVNKSMIKYIAISQVTQTLISCTENTHLAKMKKFEINMQINNCAMLTVLYVKCITVIGPIIRSSHKLFFLNKDFLKIY